MAVVIEIDPARRPLLESVVRTVAGVFDAAASSLALDYVPAAACSITRRGAPARRRSSAASSIPGAASPPG